jgi:hypothetical protein
MKALTLWQPWASAVRLGEKKIETRCWTTKYRGEMAIHAAEKKPSFLGRSAETVTFRDELADVLNCRRDRDDRHGIHLDSAIRALPRGVVLCIVKLVAIEETAAVRDSLSQRELIFGNYEDGRYAWFLEMVEVFEAPMPAKGNRMLWNWDRTASEKVR